MKTMDDLREMLFGTIADLRDGKLDAATAKTVAELSQTVINTAKAEADFARATGSKVTSNLIPALAAETAPTQQDGTSRTATGLKTVSGNVTRHTLK